MWANFFQPPFFRIKASYIQSEIRKNGKTEALYVSFIMHVCTSYLYNLKYMYVLYFMSFFNTGAKVVLC